MLLIKETINTVPNHDALAVCAVLNADVLKDVVETYMDIDIAGGSTDKAVFSSMVKKSMCK